MKYLEILYADTGRVLYTAFSKQFDIQADFTPSTLSFSLPRTDTDLSGVDAGAHLKVRVDGQQIDPNFTVNGDSTDYVSDDGIKSRAFSCTSIHSELEDASVLPSAWPNPVPSGHDFQNATPGQIIKTLVSRVQEYGYLSNITHTSFTGTHDSNGVTWPAMMDRSYSTGDTILSAIQSLVEQGQVEAKMVGYDLRLYVVDTLGETLTDVVFRVGQNLTEGSTQTDASEFYTDIFAIGDGDAAVMKSRPDSYETLGRRRMRFAQYGGITNAALLGVLADLELDQYNHVKSEHSYAVDSSFYTPFVDYNVYDLVPLDRGEGSVENIRITQISVTQDDNTGAFTVGITLGDLLEDADEKLKRRLDAITGANAGGGSVPSDKTDDKMPPNYPASISFSTTPYLDDQTRRRVLAIINWPDVTTNADGTPTSDVDHYEIQTKIGSDTDFTPATIVPTSQAVVSGYDSGTKIQVKVRTVDTSGLVSTWTTSSIYTMIDTTPSTLTVPSKPVVSVKYQQLTITWDGKDLSAKAPTLDCVGIEVHVSSTGSTFTPSDTTRIGVIPYITSGVGGSTTVNSLNPTTAYYVKFVALGRNGTQSGASVSTSAVTEALIVDPVVIGQIADDVAANQIIIDQTKDDLAAAEHDLYDAGGTVDVIKNTLTGQVNTAQAAANAAQATASGKNNVFWSTSAPGVSTVKRTNLCPSPATSNSTTSPWGILSPSNGAGTLVTQKPTQYPVGAPQTGKALRRNWTTVPTTPWNNGLPTQSHGDIYWNQAKTIPVTPGSVYTISAWVRSGTAIKAMIAAECRNTSNGVTGTTFAATATQLPVWSSAADWRRISVTFTAPAATVDVRPQIHFTNGTGTITTSTYVDVFAVLVESGSTVNAYFDGDTVSTEDSTYAWTGAVNASTSTLSSITTNPGSTIGDVWYKYTMVNGKTNILAMWKWSGTSWTSSPLDETFLPQVNIGTGTYGELDGMRLTAKSVLTDYFLAEGALGSTVIADGAITSTKITANAITAEKIKAGEITADKLYANTITGDKINANSIAAVVGEFVQVKANNILAGDIISQLNITAGGKVIAGNAEVGDGIQTFTTDDISGTRYPSTQLGVPGQPDALQILPGPDLPPVASMNNDGEISGVQVSSDNDMSVGGQPLVGTILTPEEVSRINFSPVQDFEDGSIGTPVINDASCSVSTNQHYSGTKSLKITNSASDNRVYWSVTGMPVTTGDSITLSAWVYLPAATTNYGEVLYLGGTLTSTVKVAPDWNKRDQWQRVVSTSIVGTPGGTCFPAVLMPSGGQTIYVDGMQMEIGDTVTDFFTGNYPTLADGTSYKFSGSSAIEYMPAGNAGILDQFPRGLYATYNLRNLSTMASTTVGSGYGLVGQVDLTLQPGRSYTFSMPWRALVSKTSGSTVTELVSAARVYFTMTTDGTEPPAPTATGTPLASSDVRTPAVRATGVSETLEATFGTTELSRVKLMVALYVDTNVQITPSTFSLLDWIMYIHDIGPVLTPIDAVLPGSGSQQQYSTVWTATDSRTWRNTGATYGAANSNVMYQGVSSSVGLTHAGAVFNGKATSGSEKGKTIASALAGATVTKIEIGIQSTSWEDGKGELQLRKFNGTTLSSTDNVVGSVGPKTQYTARSQWKWTSIPTSWINTTNRGIYLNTSDWQFSNTHGQFASAYYSAAGQRPQVRITYTRVA